MQSYTVKVIKKLGEHKRNIKFETDTLVSLPAPDLLSLEQREREQQEK